MARITVSYMLLLLLEFATSSPLSLKAEGNACLDATTAGTCRRVRQCPHALLAIQKRRPLPQRCGFVGTEEIVCCPEQKADATDRQVDSNDRRGNSGRRNGIPATDDRSFPVDERPSVQACRAYKDMWIGLEDYILLGRLSGQKQFPYMAALGYNVPDTEGVSWLCGGTLISDQFVLTAAHCCTNRLALRPVKVRLGENNLTETADGADYEISEILLHPTYRVRQYYGDIALLKLDKKVEFSEAVNPACLNMQDGDPPSFTAAGWGFNNVKARRLSSALLKTTIYPFPLSVCKDIYKRIFPKGMDTSFICAGDPQGKVDTCRSDSGGPLVTDSDATYTVFGIASVGPSPCGGTVPSLYTRVSSYLDWIEKHVWP